MRLGARGCASSGAEYGDGMHLVIECHGLAHLREQLASVFQERQTLQQFMWQPDMLQVAKFVICRREGDAGN